MDVFTDKSECCGCTACYAVCPSSAIEMRCDEEGFLYPFINHDKCLECGLCRDVCCLQNGTFGEEGPAPELYVAKHRLDEVRMASSSGGAFTAISDQIFSEGGVVYGAVYNDGLGVVHVRAETQKQRDAMRVSKYTQSDLGDIFRNVRNDLELGKTVLFTGTPCQVSGLRHFLQKDYAGLFTVDIICHGVPSPLMFREHIERIQAKTRKKIVQYVCRSKVVSWHKHIELATLDDGRQVYGTPLAQEHKNLFNSGYILRPSCYKCRFANLHRHSDLTMGDFWGVEKYMPDFDDQIGISLLLINTDKGRRIFEAIKPSLQYRESYTIGRQPQLHHPAEKPADRHLFWQEYRDRGYRFVANKYGRCDFMSWAKHYVKKILKRLKRLK